MSNTALGRNGLGASSLRKCCSAEQPQADSAGLAKCTVQQVEHAADSMKILLEELRQFGGKHLRS